MVNKKVKLIFITGAGRSGSTILENVLVKIKGFFCVGEMSFVWDRGIQDNRYCGCGKRFNNCKFWSKVFHNSYKRTRKPNPKKMEKILKTFYIYKIPFILRKKPSEISWAIKHLENLYKEISKIQKSDVIIDSSKWPGYGVILSQLPSVELYTIHVVRDPRAVAYSWTKKKKYEPFDESDIYMKRQNIIFSSLEWITWNVAVEMLKRKIFKNYLLIRYENLVENPNKSIKAILEFVDEENKKTPIKNKKVNLRTNHCISGNPVRFKRGFVKIVEDNEWLIKFKLIEKIIITALAFPFMLYYGYKIKQTSKN